MNFNVPQQAAPRSTAATRSISPRWGLRSRSRSRPPTEHHRGSRRHASSPSPSISPTRATFRIPFRPRLPDAGAAPTLRPSAGHRIGPRLRLLFAAVLACAPPRSLTLASQTHIRTLAVVVRLPPFHQGAAHNSTSRLAAVRAWRRLGLPRCVPAIARVPGRSIETLAVTLGRPPRAMSLSRRVPRTRSPRSSAVVFAGANPRPT